MRVVRESFNFSSAGNSERLLVGGGGSGKTEKTRFKLEGKKGDENGRRVQPGQLDHGSGADVVEEKSMLRIKYHRMRSVRTTWSPSVGCRRSANGTRVFGPAVVYHAAIVVGTFIYRANSN